jgi:hypothetical protein
MTVKWERDTWWSEELGVEGRWWWGSDTGQFRFRASFPDKAAHFLFTATFADLAWRYLHVSVPLSAALAFSLMWLGLEVRWLRSDRVLWMGSWKDTLADLAGALFWVGIRRFG